ncbi:uncharacterized protein LOC121725277 [Aricia agestis]|uniref:uncharacterized protein LOC121725277 n=1 Tax=Aricia agestis TaxID=91739 RepID=UPI001C205971|nr:uncharacterized protein LOC121725277 [Aricia agestis]
MINKKYCLLWYVMITLCGYFISAEHQGVPVFLSDQRKVLSVNIDDSPFKKMLPTDFTTIMTEVKEKGNVVLIFIEPTLSMEDVSLKDESGTPYFYLSQGIKDGNVKFLPSASSHFETLTDIFPPTIDNTFYLSGTSFSNSIKQKMFYSNLKHFYIQFQNERENRINTLRNHDRIMQEIYLTVGNINPGPVLSVYTGKANPINLHLLNVPKIRHDQELVLQSSRSMFRLAGFYTPQAEQRKFLYGEVPQITDEIEGPNSLSIRVGYLDYVIEFNFYLGEDSWIFDNVTLYDLDNEVGWKKVGAAVSWNSSYACAQPLEVVDIKNGTAVVISRIKAQPFKSQPVSEKRRSATRNKKFGPAVSCCPYFSAPILAGLLTTFLCCTFLTYAVMFLYNCHTNDRYDDPNGKPLLLEKIN